jgi:4-hydroxybenzoate polyprenyltransferase/phosphoserine phosphatase
MYVNPHQAQTGSEPLTLPLVVDLDGTLLRSDLLVETGISYLALGPAAWARLTGALTAGKAALKAAIAQKITIDPAVLPYNADVLNLVAEARRAGRPVYLASASNEAYVRAIADHLGFDGWFASNASENLAGDTKRLCLVTAFGQKGFDYVGDSRADLDVWHAARHAIAIAPRPAVRKQLEASHESVTVIPSHDGGWRSWLKLLRPHQWAKNALIFVPMLTAHKLDPTNVLATVLTFIAFSIVASSVYVFNDLVDLDADRRHPTKCKRPLAAGKVSIKAAVLAGPLLTIAGALIAASVSWPVFGFVACYFGLTLAYSFYLKRKMLIDTIVLAGLYTLRVLTGAAAVDVPVSEWLLGFSMLIFTSLALIKRYVELATRVDADLPDPANRNYRKSDLDIVAMLAAAAGFNAVTIFALYLSSDAVQHLYRTPKLLWLICPILMYWLARALLMAHRRYMDDDPIAFAMRDKNSLLAFALVVVIVLAAL